MLRKRLSESLGVRVFLLTFLLLLGAGGLTFLFIAWAAPITYTAVVSERLQDQAEVLADRLTQTDLADSGPLLDEFVRESGAEVSLTGPDGADADTGALLVLPVDRWKVSVTVSGETGLPTKASRPEEALAQLDREVGFVTTTTTGALSMEVTFADQGGVYQLTVTPQLRPANQAVEALYRVAPWLIAALLTFSLLCAVGYARYLARPIRRLSDIAGRMAELDFNWSCRETRRDEIGRLGRSLDEMARRLDTALKELETANRALQGEVEQERELDRQRMAFFSAASHELKTPVTILKGQLSGMLEGVGVYQNREQYLLRALQVTGRMEHLIQEMLAIARMETGRGAAKREVLDLSALVKGQLSLDAGLLEQKEQRLVSDLPPGITVTGDAALLEKAVENLISNASHYSPAGAEIRVRCGLQEGRPGLTVENSGVQIGEEALPHLFEAFYREERSRNRGTGGSGLGLYLVRMILERHGADYGIENAPDGVRVWVWFSGAGE